MRAQNKNDIQKDFHKLMNNSVFEKTMDNVINRIQVKRGYEKCGCVLKQVGKLTIKTFSIFDKNSIFSYIYKQKS